MRLLSKARLLEKPATQENRIREFVYRGAESFDSDGSIGEKPGPETAERLWTGPSGTASVAASAAEEPPKPENKYTEEEMQARERQAGEKGFQDAALRLRQEFEKNLAAERDSLAKALREFAQDRETYFRNVEGDVVRLALAIARKVLHRESQMDPMLLAGAVRVALEKIAEGAAVRLRVPESQVEQWKQISLPNSNLKIEVVGDETLTGPRCLVETEMGTTDTSLEAQLGEIERGFFDLLAERPGTVSKSRSANS